MSRSKCDKETYKKLTNSYRTRLRRLFKARSDIYSSFIGCSPNFLKQHIHNLIQPGMFMENYGIIWVIDHIKPVKSFNLLNIKEVNKCFHYTNLAPLYEKDNGNKSDKLDDGTSARSLKNAAVDEPEDVAPEPEESHEVPNPYKLFKSISRGNEKISHYINICTGKVKKVIEDDPFLSFTKNLIPEYIPLFPMRPQLI